ncbi:MAG: tRNA(Ile)(2)-agmatinylcytidine synthase, partial [Candidatus Bathyarchaeia archaeon]
MVVLHVGIDDTDSPRGGCTTYIAALLVEELENRHAAFIEYPKLVRLNPNVPWKTRGNGAVSLSFVCPEDDVDEIKDVVTRIVEKNSDLGYPGTDPGIVFLEGDVPDELDLFAKTAISGMVEKGSALKLAKRFGADVRSFGDGRGVIGGLAAVGERLTGDHTYELLAYRTPKNRGSERKVDRDSVIVMDRLMHSETFNNFDYERGRILITPHGPDPILLGVRGESAEAVVKAYRMLRVEEPVERWVVFKTNQGTDAHLRKVDSIRELKPFYPVIVRGKVSERPRVIPGRHVIFSLSDGTAEVDCAAYEPTGTLRKVAARLEVGDYI